MVWFFVMFGFFFKIWQSYILLWFLLRTKHTLLGEIFCLSYLHHEAQLCLETLLHAQSVMQELSQPRIPGDLQTAGTVKLELLLTKNFCRNLYFNLGSGLQHILPNNASHQSFSQWDFRVSARSHLGSFLRHRVIATNRCKTAGDLGAVQATGSNVLEGTSITRHTQCIHTERLCLSHPRWYLYREVTQASSLWQLSGC